MKTGDIFEAINKFFLDIIGSIIPGIIFVLGLRALLNQPKLIDNIFTIPPKDNAGWIFLIILSYLSGYIVLSIAENLVLPFIELIPEKIKPKNFRSRKFIEDSIKVKASYKIAIYRISESYKFTSVDDVEKDRTEEENFRFWRNLALAITQENNALVYRFMFISLLNLGVATSLLTTSIVWLILGILKEINLIFTNVIGINLSLVFIMIVISVAFLDRYYQFYRRAMETPFGLVIVKLHEEIKSKPV
jgi:hypothetical protein